MSNYYIIHNKTKSLWDQIIRIGLHVQVIRVEVEEEITLRKSKM